MQSSSRSNLIARAPISRPRGRAAAVALGLLPGLFGAAACNTDGPPEGEWTGAPGAFESRGIEVPASPEVTPTAATAPGWGVRVVDGMRALSRIAVAGDYIYFAAKEAGMYRARKNGGAVEVVEAGSKTLYTEVAAAQDNVYWLKTIVDDNDHPHVLVRHQVAGSATIATRWEGDWSTLWSNTALHFQADAQGVYVNATPPGGRASGIQNLPAEGGTPIEMLAIRDVSESPVWAVDDRDLYFTTCQLDVCQLAVVSKSGGAPQKLAELPASFAAVRAVDATSVYLNTASALWKVSKQGGEPIVLFTMRSSTIAAPVVADLDRLYFLERRGGSYRVRSVLKTGAGLTGAGSSVLGTGAFVKGISQIVEDDTSLYLLHGTAEILVQPKTLPPAP